jgi:hypothetical protein
MAPAVVNSAPCIDRASSTSSIRSISRDDLYLRMQERPEHPTILRGERSPGSWNMPYVGGRSVRRNEAGYAGNRVADSVTPVEIANPALFASKPASLAAGKAFGEAAQRLVPQRSAENMKLGPQAELAAAETTLGAAISAEASEPAEQSKSRQSPSSQCTSLTPSAPRQVKGKSKVRTLPAIHSETRTADEQPSFTPTRKEVPQLCPSFSGAAFRKFVR